MSEKIETKEEIFLKSYINKQFEIAGHDMTYHKLYETGLDLPQDNPSNDWFMVYTCNQSQEEELYEWFIETYARLFNVNKFKGHSSARKAWSVMHLHFGLARNDIQPVREIDQLMLDLNEEE